MSRAEDEALHFAATTSLLYSKHMDVALADAYKRGRLAPPTDTEIEAVVDSDWEDFMPSADCFSTLTPGLRAIYLRNARKLLEIARKAVNE